jgi:hypothetical protein
MRDRRSSKRSPRESEPPACSSAGNDDEVPGSEFKTPSVRSIWENTTRVSFLETGRNFQQHRTSPSSLIWRVATCATPNFNTSLPDGTPNDCRLAVCRRQGDDQPMRDTSPRPWHRWRVTLAESKPVQIRDRFGRLPISMPVSAEFPEQPAADGIRHKLVARIRQEIAAGTYDTEEKWLAAEEELIRRIEER